MTGKTIIYQMLPRLWGNPVTDPERGGGLDRNGCGRFCNVDTETLSYLKDLGISHVWYTGIIRHATLASEQGCIPSDSSWVKGNAGSPYSINDYYDVNPYLASEPENRMEEFEALVSRTHEAGLKVIIDFVPNHVARDYGRFTALPVSEDGRDANGHHVLGACDDDSVHWKAENDFFYYPGRRLELPIAADSGKQEGRYVEFPAKASGNCYGPTPSINDWYDTIKLNYCDFPTPTWEKMYDILRFWAGKGVDGFRCDMVELVPAEFFKWAIARLKNEFPGISFIAEVYEKHLYGKYIHDTGFDLLYDKSGLYDALRDIIHANTDRRGLPLEEWQSTRRITGNWQFLGNLQPRMLNFLENHDEQRIASDFFAGKADNCFAALHVSLLLNNSAFMIYSGQEIGERGMDAEGKSGLDGRTSIFDWWAVASLGRLYAHVHGHDALTGEEKRVLDKYRALLRTGAGEPAFFAGETYDLCYFNFSSAGFDKNRHFAFLRKYGERVFLIAANFAAAPARIGLRIPAHAFEWLKLPITENLSPDTPLEIEVPPMDGVIKAL